MSTFVWGHIDDILVSHENYNVLLTISKTMQEMFNNAKWVLNMKKSVLTPVNRIVFLGSVWTSNTVTRTKTATSFLKD